VKTDSVPAIHRMDLSNFRKLWEDGLGKLAAVYFLSLFSFIIWVSFVISWLFFAGVRPPLAS
jgi:hypothetical protein